jgi:hypothetical protein
MSNWIDERMAEELRKDLLRAAERRRLIAQAIKVRRPSARFYSQVLVRIGRGLEVWGCRLQTRYGTLAKAGSRYAGRR